MTEDMEAIYFLRVQNAEHIAGDVLRLVAVIGLIAVAEAAHVRSDQRVAVAHLLEQWKVFPVALRPAVYAQHHRTLANGDVVKIDAVRLDALMLQFDGFLCRRGILRFLCGLGQRGSCCWNRCSGERHSGNRYRVTSGQSARMAIFCAFARCSAPRWG